MANAPKPLLHTPDDQLNQVEQFKLASNMVRGILYEDFRDDASDELTSASEQLAKSHGVYLEYNRAKTGKEKDWMYMVRISIPGGGPLNAQQWAILDDVSRRMTRNTQGIPSIRLTNRQNIQFHWVKKHDVVEMVQQIARTGYFTLNGCGDNTRNVMGCPLSRYSTLYDANAMANKLGTYFRIDAEPHIQVFEIDTSLIRTPDEHYAYGPKLLNRKFKMAFSAVHQNEQTGQWEPDNCVELRTNDLGVSPIVKDGKLQAFQVYLGGGQGEKNGKPTAAMLGKPFGIFTQENLLAGIDAIVKVHEEWGDRKNRHWARLKYVINEQGIDWYQKQVRERGASFEQPDPDHDIGDRKLHHGWTKQPSNGKWAFGAYIDCGRIINGPNGKGQDMVMHVMDKYEGLNLLITPNQDALFCDIDEAAKEDFVADLESFGFGKRNGKTYSTLRVLSGACVGLDTCRLAYTDSENFEPELIDALEKMGHGDVHESIGITGCERQCFRPATKSVGWVGSGPDMYQLKVGGSESARYQGIALVHEGEMYLRQVKRDDVAVVTGALFEFHKQQRQSNDEDLGAFLRRVGAGAIIEYLKRNPMIAPYLEKTKDAPYIPEDSVTVGD